MKTSVLNHPREWFCLQFKCKYLPFQLPNNFFLLYGHPWVQAIITGRDRKVGSLAIFKQNHAFDSFLYSLSFPFHVHWFRRKGDSVGLMCVIKSQGTKKLT